MSASRGGALESFQDREGLVVDGIARPGGQTERHLSHMADREAERAARPARIGPIRFGTLTTDNYRESHGMARGVVRRRDHRSAVAFRRQVFEDDPGGALPEAMQLADRVDDRNRKHGKRFRPGPRSSLPTPRHFLVYSPQGGWWRTGPSPTRSDPEGSSRNEFRPGSVPASHFVFSIPGI